MYFSGCVFNNKTYSVLLQMSKTQSDFFFLNLYFSTLENPFLLNYHIVLPKTSRAEYCKMILCNSQGLHCNFSLKPTQMRPEKQNICLKLRLSKSSHYSAFWNFIEILEEKEKN